MTKTLAKSLHTVTVLRRVATHIADTEELLPEDCLAYSVLVFAAATKLILGA